MCGISGFVLKAGERAERETLEAMGEAMRRRGPDGAGIFARENVGLSHRRLKIIDLSEQAAQPLFNEDGRVGVVFNGEIYNFRELRSELEALGHRFRSRSDTEVLVHGFEQWGEDAWLRLDGMFAFALWDGRGQEPVLHLVRDRFGIKPLFYSESGGRLGFASELKPLLCLPWIGRELDREALFQFLEFSHVPCPLSILRGVRQLEPGSWLRFRGGRAAGGRYWDALELARASAAPIAESDALAELDRALAAAVERQLVSDVPVGCYLSGGVDSSLLTMAFADSLKRGGAGGRLHTFSIGYREREFDETPFAREVARAAGSEHHELVARPADFFGLIPEVPELFDQPLADPTLLSSLLLAKLAREHVTVALSGDGGDELFFGYPHQRALLKMTGTLAGRALLRAPARAAAFSRLESAARAGARFPARVGRRAQQAAKLAEILQARGEAELFQCFVGMIGPLRLDRVAGLLAEPPAAEPWLSRLLARLEGLAPHARVEQVFLRTFLVDTVLAKTDRAGMAYGLEARVPFLDHELAAFSARLPLSLKLRGGRSKHLLRTLFERKLRRLGVSGALARRPKQGFSIPLREWLRGELKYLLDEYLAPPRLAREGLLDPGVVGRLVREHLDGRANHSHLLWSLVTLQMWKERYLP